MNPNQFVRRFSSFVGAVNLGRKHLSRARSLLQAAGIVTALVWASPSHAKGPGPIPH